MKTCDASCVLLARLKPDWIRAGEATFHRFARGILRAYGDDTPKMMHDCDARRITELVPIPRLPSRGLRLNLYGAISALGSA